MKSAARALASELSPRDQVAVVAFAAHPHLLLPFSADRSLLEAALTRIDLMRSVEESGSNIYGSLYLAAEVFSAAPAASGHKAVILLTDGQDSGLGLSWDPASMYPTPGKPNYLTFEDVIRQLGAAWRVFVLSAGVRRARRDLSPHRRGTSHAIHSGFLSCGCRLASRLA
jgi:Mg-chelatase subunit ChlD